MIRDKLTPLVVTTEHQPDRLVGAGDSPRFSLYACSSFASSLALLHVASQQTASTRDQQTSTHIKEGIAF